MNAEDNNEYIAEALQTIIAQNEETFERVSEILRYYSSQTEKDYQRFITDPYPILAAEFGPELSTIDADELRAMIKSGR